MDIRHIINRPLSLLLALCLLLAMAPAAGAAGDCTCTDKCTFSAPNSGCAHCASAEESGFSCRGTYASNVSGTLSRTYGADLGETFTLNITGGSGQLTLTGDKTYTVSVSGTATVRWSDVLNAQRDAGTHSLDWSFAPASADYRASSGRLTFQVYPRTVNATVQLSQTSFVYDGTAKTPTATVTGDSRTLTEGVEYTLKYLNNTAPGTATVQLQDVAGDNYTVSGQAAFTITKASTDIGAVTYSGPALLDSMAPGAVVLSRANGSVPGVLTLTALKLSAGTNTYDWVFIPDDSGFESVSGTVSLTVSHDWGEGSCTQAPTCKGCGATNGTAPGHTLSYSAGGDTVTERCTTPGYEHSATVKLELIPGASTQYTGSEIRPLKLTYSEGWVGPKDLTVTYTGNTEIGTATGSVTVGGATAKKTFQIEPIPMSVTATDKTVTYNGSAHSVTVSGPQGATVRYGTVGGTYDLTEAPSYKNAGEYTVYYQVTKEDHRTVEGSVKLTVKPAALTVTVEDAEKTYGDADPAFTWKLTSGTLAEGDRLTDIAVTRAQGEDAGTYALEATDNGRNRNYAITFRPGTLTVLRREITISWEGLELTYNGKEQAPTATAGNTVFGDKLELTVSGGRTDATKGQKVTAKVTMIVGEKAGNYKLPGDVSVQFEIKKAALEIVSLRSTNETAEGKKDGTILDVTPDMEYRPEGQTDYIPITGTKLEGLAPGVYEVRYRESDNCSVSSAIRVTINAGPKLKIILPAQQPGYELTVDKAEVPYGGSAVLTFKLVGGSQKTEDFALKVNGTAVALRPDGKYELKDIKEDLTVTVEGVSDAQPPKAEILLGGRKWDSFLAGVRFELYYASAQNVTVKAEDEGSGVDTIHYHLSYKELTLAQLENIYDWSKYTGSFTIRPENKYVIYVRVTDKAGNTTYINSTGLIFDSVGPSINGVRNKGIYYTTQKVEAADNFRLSSFKCDGSTFNGTLQGDPDVETKHTLTAWDAAGNSTSITVTMKPISSLEEKLPERAALKLEDEAAIREVLKTVQEVLKSGSKHATAGEKAQLEALEQKCLELLAVLEAPAGVKVLLDALPDAKTARPDDRKAIDALDTAQASWDALTAEGKALLGEAGERLTALRKALTDYRITEGDKAKWTRGETKGLVFVGNGYCGPLDGYEKGAYGKFLGIEIDGKTVDPQHYAAHSGSTIVSLKASYLETLETGKHTVRMIYTDGETDEATFRISEPRTMASQTGGFGLVGILFWAALGLAALVGIALIVLLILWKKEKH